MKRIETGVTLIELLIVVAITAILAALAAPSFSIMLAKRSAVAAAQSLVSDMRLARSEALKRSTRTVICRSTDGESCAGTAGSWSVGWIVFVDRDSSSGVSAGDDLLRVQEALPNIATIRYDAVPANTLHSFKYEPTGWAKAASLTLNVTPRGDVSNAASRLVCVSVTGRPALRAEGAVAC